jgi:hypothetical protein
VKLHVEQQQPARVSFASMAANIRRSGAAIGIGVPGSSSDSRSYLQVATLLGGPTIQFEPWLIYVSRQIYRGGFSCGASMPLAAIGGCATNSQIGGRAQFRFVSRAARKAVALTARKPMAQRNTVVPFAAGRHDMRKHELSVASLVRCYLPDCPAKAENEHSSDSTPTDERCQANPISDGFLPMLANDEFPN